MFEYAFVWLCVCSALAFLPVRLSQEIEHEYGPQDFSLAINVSFFVGIIAEIVCLVLTLWLYKWWMIFVLLVASGLLAGVLRVVFQP